MRKIEALCVLQQVRFQYPGKLPQTCRNLPPQIPPTWTDDSQADAAVLVPGVRQSKIFQVRPPPGFQ